MREFLFGQNSVLIVSALFVSMLLFMEMGYRLGHRRHTRANDSIRSQANGSVASMLGLLALLLGFTFSLALHRYDDRSEHVVLEANAIRSAYFTSQLLPAPMRDEARTLLHRYLDLRIQEGRVNLTASATRESLMLQANQIALRIWEVAERAMEQDPRPITTGLFIQSVTKLIEARDSRNASLARHVPEIVLFLLFATFLLTAGTLGYASGISGHRVTLPAFITVVLIVLVVYLIIDMDRPRRGYIRVNQESMLSLWQSIETMEGRGSGLESPHDTL